MAILRRGSHTHAELLHAGALHRWLAARTPQPAVLQRHIPPKGDVRWVVTYAARGGVAEVVAIPRRFGDAYAQGVVVPNAVKHHLHSEQQQQDDDEEADDTGQAGQSPQVWRKKQ